MLAELIKLVADGQLSHLAAKDVFIEMAKTGSKAAAVVEQKGLRQISDTSELEKAIQTAFGQNASALADLKAGKKQARGFFIGQVMRATGGKANPKLVGELIDKLIRE